MTPIVDKIARDATLCLANLGGFRHLIERSSLGRRLVHRFIAGETLPEAVDVVAALSGAGFRTTVDRVGEAVSDPAGARIASSDYLELLERLHALGLEQNVSLKPSQLGLDVSAELAQENIGAVVQRAASTGGFVRLDMEGHAKRDDTLALVRRLHVSVGHVGTVIQANLGRSAEDVRGLVAEAIPIRLCKGAYREPTGVAYQRKSDVDRNYGRLSRYLIAHGANPAFATHDPRMISGVLVAARRVARPPSDYEFQMLFGIRQDIQERLVQLGYTVRVYVPYGREWYPYFTRRLAERPANLMFFTRALLGGLWRPHVVRGAPTQTHPEPEVKEGLSV